MFRRCPYCRKNDFWRMYSYRWMRILPFMHNRRCNNCGHEVARWFGLFYIRHGTARAIANLFLFLEIALLIVGAVWGIPKLVAWLRYRP